MNPAMMQAAGGVLGAGLGILGAFIGSGKKPQIPKWTGVDPTKVQKQTIAGNTQNLGAAQNLAGQVNLFNMEQFNKLLDLALPGLRSQATTNTAALLRGELPSDVQSSILRSGAARSLGLGVGGTGFGRNLTLRDLGLTSMQAQQQGFSQFGSLAGMYAPRLMDVQSMFFTPQQRAQIGMWDAEKRWERDLMAAGVAAQASPLNANIGNILAQIGGGMAGASVSSMMQPSFSATPPAPTNWGSLPTGLPAPANVSFGGY